MRTIVLGYDGSPQSERALERTIVYAGALGAKVVVVTADTLVRWEVRNEGEEERRLADVAAGRLRAAGIEATGLAGVGEPAKVIADAAEEHAAELVVVGGRDMTWLDRLIQGSVSDSLAHRVHHVDVLIVH